VLTRASVRVLNMHWGSLVLVLCTPAVAEVAALGVWAPWLLGAGICVTAWRLRPYCGGSVKVGAACGCRGEAGSAVCALSMSRPIGARWCADPT